MTMPEGDKPKNKAQVKREQKEQKVWAEQNMKLGHETWSKKVSS
eukprot:CAMPEP_0170558800 /NCGR_PEP_ID=MMETSP0211-20121228/37953_1 /TAXON_ID=311385 /ORGANISM="Pseudokeronopsis sp., Strain OXSARD2" /LENGTH=43 /DNA_ID= /DNA_START= /DNA_END= /DNA_ORIENTATION=